MESWPGFSDDLTVVGLKLGGDLEVFQHPNRYVFIPDNPIVFRQPCN